MPEEKINHPAHYNQLPHEVIEIVADQDFCSGNVVKYLIRAPYKGNAVDDLKKARWYLIWLLEHNYPIGSRDLYHKEYRMTCENANAISGPGAKEISKAIKLFVSGYGEEAWQNNPPAGVTDGGCERSRGHALDWGKHRVEKGEGRSLVPSARAPQPKVHEVQGRRYQEVGEIRRYGSLSVSFP